MNIVSLLLGVFLWAATLPAQEEFRLKHPLPDYSVYSDFEITAMVAKKTLSWICFPSAFGFQSWFKLR
ncbi:MAG: hypothetical protein ACPGR8_06215 [Limisphaerales bacterium]